MFPQRLARLLGDRGAGHTGDVATHQGASIFPRSDRTLTRLEDWKIMRQIFDAPRVQLKEHKAKFRLSTGVLISYGAFCKAVHRLGFTRKRICARPRSTCLAAPAATRP